MTPHAVVIVLVEDEVSIRTILTRSLGRMGYTIHAFERGEPAVEFVRDHAGPIDALLVDTALPGINGVETAARIRALRSGIVVVRMSGYSIDVYDGGPTSLRSHFIQKPFTTETLKAKLVEVLGRNPTAPVDPT